MSVGNAVRPALLERAGLTDFVNPEAIPAELGETLYAQYRETVRNQCAILGAFEHWQQAHIRQTPSRTLLLAGIVGLGGGVCVRKTARISSRVGALGGACVLTLQGEERVERTTAIQQKRVGCLSVPRLRPPLRPGAPNLPIKTQKAIVTGFAFIYYMYAHNGGFPAGEKRKKPARMREGKAKIIVYVDTEKKNLWSERCRATGASESAATGALIEKELSKELPQKDDSIISTAPRLKQITLKLNDPSFKKLHSRMKQDGYSSPTVWATSCVMAALHNDAVPSEEERRALEESGRQLSAIGRNLNQIARALNADPSESSSVNEKLVSSLSASITAHVEKVSSLLEKSRKRWRTPRG